MNTDRFSCVILSVFFFFCCYSHAQAEPVQPTLLELSATQNMPTFTDNHEHTLHGYELEVALGLGWLPSQYLSLHAKLGLSWFYAFDIPFEYAHHQQVITGQHLGAFDVAVMLEVHLPSRLPAIYAELVVKSFIAAHRAGIFQTHAGIGLSFAPFFEPNATLRTTQFGLGVRFPISDDFEKVFGLSHAPVQLNMHVLWGF
ncbi:MAG: hypothetical protein J6A01_06715 [Proteobacteria bacterium]|nr:hypothetical protein [Pseudomonadota bacterium]